MKKNGKRNARTQWRCKNTTCGVSEQTYRPDITAKHHFTYFHNHVTGIYPITECARLMKVSTRTVYRYFEPLWLMEIPNNPDRHRIHDQIFIDGTYTAAGCLLIASTSDHVLCWHWCKQETTHSYTQLLSKLAAPLCVVLDGGQGAQATIKKLWPNTLIQRCLIHAQRVVRRYVTSRPRTEAGREIYNLALELTSRETVQQARKWAVDLHKYGIKHHDFLNEKNPLPPEINRTGKRYEFTHRRVRSAYNSLTNLHKKGHLFTYLTPPKQAIDKKSWASNTNKLEGGINSQLKFIARCHRGRGGERQRKMLEWWLYNKTPLPDDPHKIARQQNWGKDQLAKVHVLTHTENHTNHETGRPALYDNAIPTEYNHSVGIRKGTIR